MKKNKYKIVIDTNVFITALKSKRGASYKLLFETSRQKYTQYISTPLIFEYESVSSRKNLDIKIAIKDINAIIDKICNISVKTKLFFLWRPYLKDPRDDHVFELAMESKCDFIITYNIKDFKGIEKFNIKPITPKEFLKILGEIK